MFLDCKCVEKYIRASDLHGQNSLKLAFFLNLLPFSLQNFLQRKGGTATGKNGNKIKAQFLRIQKVKNTEAIRVSNA